MRRSAQILMVILMSSCFGAFALRAAAFEGRIWAVMMQGGQTNELLYTVGTNQLRVERTATNAPNPVDILNLESDALTLVFPNNRSFIRFKLPTENATPATPDPRPIPPPPVNGSASAMATMPVPVRKLELNTTGQTTNLLGLVCRQFEVEQGNVTLEIWATDQLTPYQPYLTMQPHQIGPSSLEEKWAGLLARRKLFPLLVTMRIDKGPERLRFKVTSIMPQKLTADDTGLFQPPPGYNEMQPLPF
jgi:Domain of unknown function (DUF4412)